MKFFIPLNQILFSHLHMPNMQITHVPHISLMFYLVLIAKLIFKYFGRVTLSSTLMPNRILFYEPLHNQLLLNHDMKSRLSSKSCAILLLSF